MLHWSKLSSRDPSGSVGSRLTIGGLWESGPGGSGYDRKGGNEEEDEVVAFGGDPGPECRQ